MRDWQERTGKPVFFFAHREELLEQAERMMEQFGLRGKVISIFSRKFDTSAEEMSIGLCKWVTERAYDNPKFVEDLVRDVALAVEALDAVAAYTVESENFESIHNHSAHALIERVKP